MGSLRSLPPVLACALAAATAVSATELETRSYAPQAEDPLHSAISIQNRGDDPAVVEMGLLNGRLVFHTMQDIAAEVDAIPPEGDASLATRIFRFVTDNRQHGFDLTTNFDWLLTPTLFFNSSGVALCGEAAEEIHLLAASRGLDGRVWRLGGHIVAEVWSGGRWQMYDADYGVYFLNRQGQIASFAELESDSTLITDPVLRLETPGPWSPYTSAYADLFATTWNNSIRSVVPRATLPPRRVTFTLPPGASLRFPGRFAAPPLDFQGGPMVDYGNLLLRLPAGTIGQIANPLVVDELRGTGSVAIDGQTLSLGSPALQETIDSRSSAIEEMELLDAASAVEVIYLLNPMRWEMDTVNELELRLSPAAELHVGTTSTGGPGADSDLDGVPDDGDASGIVGDAPCAHAHTPGCDDSCVSAANGVQLDADGDGRGNACDGDFDQDEIVSAEDRWTLLACSGGGTPPDDPDCTESDLDESGQVDAADVARFDELWDPSSCGLGPEIPVLFAGLALLRTARREWRATQHAARLCR